MAFSHTATNSFSLSASGLLSLATIKLIKKSIVDTHLKVDTTAAREVRYTVTPDPITAEADDNFGFNEIYSEFTDAK